MLHKYYTNFTILARRALLACSGINFLYVVVLVCIYLSIFMKKNIVVIGGGSASAMLLEALRKHRDKHSLAVIGSMADNGGSTGRLRKDLGVSALGALRKCLLALSNEGEAVKNAFAYRFQEGCLKGHTAGNIFMAAMEKTTGSAEKALEIMRKVLKVKGDVLPFSFGNVALFAELENGEIIEGETNIDIPKHNGNLKIKRIFLRPKARANAEAIKKIISADLIIIGPGDLYTTILPNFLVPGISEALKKSKAKKVFIVNSVTKFGETNNFSVSDFAREAEKYIGGSVDLVLYNSRKIPPREIKKFENRNQEVLGAVKIDKNLDKCKFIGKNILLAKKPLVDFEKLAKIITDMAR